MSALRCVALRCVALRCVALRCVRAGRGFTNLFFLFSRFYTYKFSSVQFSSVQFSSVQVNSGSVFQTKCSPVGSRIGDPSAHVAASRRRFGLGKKNTNKRWRRRTNVARVGISRPVGWRRRFAATFRFRDFSPSSLRLVVLLCYTQCLT